MEKEQPLIVEIGTRECNAMFRRRDRSESDWLEKHIEQARPENTCEIDGLDEMYPDGFPREWFE